MSNLPCSIYVSCYLADLFCLQIVLLLLIIFNIFIMADNHSNAASDQSNDEGESHIGGMTEGEASGPAHSSPEVEVEQTSPAAADATDATHNVGDGGDDGDDNDDACSDSDLDRPIQEDLGHNSTRSLLDEEEEEIKRHSLQILALTSNSAHSSRNGVDQSLKFPFPRKQDTDEDRPNKSTSTDFCTDFSNASILTASFSSSVAPSMKTSFTSVSDAVLRVSSKAKLDSVVDLAMQEEGHMDEIASSLEYWKEQNSNTCPDSSDQGRPCERTNSDNPTESDCRNGDHDSPQPLVSTRQESQVGAYAMPGQRASSDRSTSNSNTSVGHHLGVGIPVVPRSTALVCATLAEDPEDVEAQVRARIINEAVQAEVVSMEEATSAEQRISKKHKTYCALVVILVLVVVVAVGIPIGVSKQQPSQDVDDASPMEAVGRKSTIREIQDRGILRCGVYDTTRPINIVSGMFLLL